MEKSRNANNQKPEFSYAWDINNGNVQYLGDNTTQNTSSGVPVVTPDVATTNTGNVAIQNANIVLDDSDDEEMWFADVFFMIRGAMKMHSQELE